LLGQQVTETCFERQALGERIESHRRHLLLVAPKVLTLISAAPPCRRSRSVWDLLERRLATFACIVPLPSSNITAHPPGGESLDDRRA